MDSTILEALVPTLMLAGGALLAVLVARLRKIVKATENTIDDKVLAAVTAAFAKKPE